MTRRQDYYQVLGVGPTATVREIRAAWRRKVFELHPDRLSHRSAPDRRAAENELKKVNRAYEALRTEAKRQRYHRDWLYRNSPPKPVVAPSVVDLGVATPGVTQTASFVIRNDGGPYESIWVSDPDSWVQLSGYRSLQADDELPLEVDLTATGKVGERSYAESIAVHLDDVEATVRVQLRTRPAPAGRPRPAAGVSRGRTGGAPAPAPSGGWGVVAWGVALVAFVIFIASVGSGETDNRPSAGTNYYQSNAGSNYRPPPTPRSWSTVPQSVLGTGQPSQFGQSSLFQQNSTGIPQAGRGFRQPSQTAPQPFTSFRGGSPGVQSGSPGNRSSFGGQPGRSTGSFRGSGVSQPSSGGFSGFSGGFGGR